jgi:hypothetical protein
MIKNARMRGVDQKRDDTYKTKAQRYREEIFEIALGIESATMRDTKKSRT